MIIPASGLREASLAEVCSLVTDGTHDTPKRVTDGYPLIKAKEITEGSIDFTTCDQISEADHLQVIARSKPEKGDTLFAHIGASLGQAAYVNTHRPFSIKNIALFKPNPAIIDGRYLFYLVVSPPFQALAKNARTGSAQPFLSLGHLRSHRVCFHADRMVQRRIASILGAYDDLIEVNRRRIGVLEEMARRRFEEWLTGSILVENSLGEIAFIEWGDTKTTKASYTASGFVAYSASGPDGFLDHYDHEGLGIVLSAIGAQCGKSWLADGQWSCIKNTIWIKGRPEKASTPILFLLLSDANLWPKRGAAQPFISQGDARKLKVNLPKYEEQTRLDGELESLLKLGRILRRSNLALSASRDLLLPRLISGELSVDTAERELEDIA